MFIFRIIFFNTLVAFSLGASEFEENYIETQEQIYSKVSLLETKQELSDFADGILEKFANGHLNDQSMDNYCLFSIIGLDIFKKFQGFKKRDFPQNLKNTIKSVNSFLKYLDQLSLTQQVEFIFGLQSNEYQLDVRRFRSLGWETLINKNFQDLKTVKIDNSFAFALDFALIDASISGNIALFNILLQKEWKIDEAIKRLMPITVKYGLIRQRITQTPPLHFAVAKEHFAIAKKIIKNSNSLNIIDHNPGEEIVGSALALASSLGKKDMVRFLIEHGAQIDGLYSPTQYFRVAGSDACFKTGSPITFPTISPLYCAVFGGHQDIVENLLNHGANPNITNSDNIETPLQIACLNGFVDIANVLLKNNADVNQANETGATPLIIAVEQGYLNIVALLLITNKVDVNLKDKKGFNKQCTGKSALHIAALLGRVDIIDPLISYGSNINDQDGEGRTPLYFAARSLNSIAVKYLLDAGSNGFNTPDTKGNTILHHFVSDNDDPEIDQKVLELMLQYGADINFKKPLHMAVQNNKLEKALLLLSKGADDQTLIPSEEWKTPFKKEKNWYRRKNFAVFLAEISMLNTTNRPDKKDSYLRVFEYIWTHHFEKCSVFRKNNLIREISSYL